MLTTVTGTRGAGTSNTVASPVFDKSADYWARLTLPYERPPDALWGNTRTHWRQRHLHTRMVRTDVANLARHAHLHRLDRPVRHVSVVWQWAPGDNRRRDADNGYPMLKAICDGLARGRRDLIGIDLVPDDVPKWMTKHTPILVPPPAKGMWVDISIWFEEAS